MKEDQIIPYSDRPLDTELFKKASISIDFNDLDAAAKPANLRLARQYRSETCIRKLHNNTLLPYPICSTDIGELGQYGSGLELYLKLIKSLAFTFFLIACISCYPIYLNSKESGLTAGDIHQRWDTWAVSNLDIVSNTTEQSANQSTLLRLFICDSACSVIFIVFIVFFQVYSNSIVKKNFRKNVTLADYAVEVYGLPEEEYDTETVKQHFEQFGEVFEVYLARRYNNALTLYKKRAELSNKLAYLNLLKSYGKNKASSIAEVLKKLNEFDDMIRFEEETSSKTHDELPVIRGFVVYKDYFSRKLCFDSYKRDKSCCKRLKHQSAYLKYKSVYPLKVTPTAAPSSIIYENLEVTNSELYSRKAVSILAVIIALIASIAMVYALKIYQDDLPSDQTCASVNSSLPLSQARSIYTTDTQVFCYCKKHTLPELLNDSDMFNFCGYFFQKTSISVALRVSVSFGVVLVNYLIKIIFTIIGRFERVGNKSIEQLKLLSKVFVATFINTALVILAVNANFSDLRTETWMPGFVFNANFSDFSRQWYVQVGSTLVSTMIISVFSPHCVLLVTFYPLGLCKRHCFVNRYVTQAEINNKFSGADFNLATRNSLVLTTVFTCYLYSGGMPIMNVICFLFLFTLYWVDKFLILRHYKKPPMFNHLINERVLHYLPFAVAFHCGFTLYMFGATDIFPYNVNNLTGVTSDNSLTDRIKAVTGFINIILIFTAFAVAFWVYFYAKIFTCVMNRKVMDVDHVKNAQGSVETEILNIRAHGLDTYDISQSPEYKEIIKSMNSAALKVKGKQEI